LSSRLRPLFACLAVLAVAIVVGACGSSKSGGSGGSTSAAGSSGASGSSASSGASGSSGSSGGGGGGGTACSPSQLKTHTPGVLTVATDKPAYPPYFEHDDPTNGQGFESATAYAIAKQLGYPRSKVKWVTEPFNSSYAPGPKSFDFDINEISITPAREKVVDFSTPYYTNPQGILVMKSSPLAHASSLAAFKSAKLGVQVGTTSLSALQSAIKPSTQAQVFNTSSDVVSAFKINRVQAVVVDLATAFELTSEVKGSTIAGQFSAPGGDHWGALLAKGSPLTSCVSQAITTLQKNGTLAKLSKRWIASAAKVPELH
jgi:polar amino acid transport system substrate-binding protein